MLRTYLVPRKKNKIKNEYVELCYNVMCDIQEKHKCVICNEDNPDKDVVDIYERNYIITFSYLMGMRNMRDDIIDSDKFVSGELHKEISRLDKRTKPYLSMTKLFRKKTSTPYFIPDFLIHNSNKANDNNAKQLLILEAKTTKKLSANGFNKDLYKLNMYIEKLNFETSIFLVINNTYNKVNAYLEKYVKKYWFSTKIYQEMQSKKVKHRIFFLIQEEVEKQPEIYELVITREKQ